MFYNARSFNSDISLWQVGNLLYADYMFAGANAFNQDLSTWDGKFSLVGSMKSLTALWCRAPRNI